MNKKIVAVLLGAVMAVMTACGSGSSQSTENSGGGSTASASGSESTGSSDSDGKYHVGILAENDLSPMSETVEGVRSQLSSKYGDNIRFDYVCADDSDDKYDEALTRFVGDGDDVIVAVGDEALTHAAAATSKIPIVGACVTDYLSTGLINSEDQPGGNITGVTDFPPIAQQAQMITNYFVSGGHVSDDYVGGVSSGADSSEADSTDVTASLDSSSSGDTSSENTSVNSESDLSGTSDLVGVLYTSDDRGSEFTARVMDKYLSADGVSWKNYEVKDKDDLESTVKEACGECTVIYLPADLVFAENMAVIRSVTLEEKIPVITAESSMCAAGGLATYSIDYTKEGEKAADMVSDIIERNRRQKEESASGGASTEESEEEAKKGNPEKMTIENVEDTASYLYNPVTAQEIGWSVRDPFSALTDTHDDVSTSQSANPGTGTRTYSDTSAAAQ